MLKVKLYEHGTLSYHAVTNFTCLNTDSRGKRHGIKHFPRDFHDFSHFM